MSTSKPAALDGSLLARKGDASPAISNNSPLLEELGEPRGEQPGGPLGVGGSSAGGIKLLAWLARHPVIGVLGLALGIAILFGVTIVALTPSQETISRPILPQPSVKSIEPEKIEIPTDASAMTEPSKSGVEPVVKEAKPELVQPKAAAVQTLPKPPVIVKSVVPKPPLKPVSKPVVASVPSGQTGRYLLQLSAVPTAKSARSELTRLKKRLGNILGTRKLIVVKAVPRGKPPVYRLRASPYVSRSSARAACNQIRKKKMACIVIRR
jgi:cell division septation protein DedD